MAAPPLKLKLSSAPLALGAAPKPKVEDLLLPRSEGHWLPDDVLGVLARTWQQVEPGIRRTPEELRGSLSVAQWPSSDVLKRTAKQLAVPREDLERYLRARPWTKEAELPSAKFKPPSEKSVELWEGWGQDGYSYRPLKVSLEEEIRAADLEPHMGRILAAGGKVMGVDELFRTFKAKDGTPGRDGLRGFLLSPSRLGSHADARLSMRLNLRHFSYGYGRFFTPEQALTPRGNPKPLPKQYMDFITASGEPVVFLVPRGGLRGNTANEFKWLLDHPERMKNVTFVLGAFHRESF